MISLVTAPPGGGKSYYAVRSIAKALQAGKFVATNIDLRADWPEYVARRSWPMWVRRVHRRRFLASARDRVHVTDDLSELFSIRLDGSRESRGLMVLDEAHNWMNARTWTAAKRGEIVRFFTQHRKLGWDVLLIAQDASMLDRQVRILFEYHIHLRNLRRTRVPLIGVPITLGWNLFLAIWTWHASQHVIVKRECFPLSWPKGLYETMATFAALDDEASEGSVIRLPSPPGARTRPQAPAGAGDSDAAAPGPEAGSLDPETGGDLVVLDPSA